MVTTIQGVHRTNNIVLNFIVTLDVVVTNLLTKPRAVGFNVFTIV